nr:gata zinc finger domain-containing protein 10 [Quercus suber]
MPLVRWCVANRDSRIVTMTTLLFQLSSCDPGSGSGNGHPGAAAVPWPIATPGTHYRHLNLEPSSIDAPGQTCAALDKLGQQYHWTPWRLIRSVPLISSIASFHLMATTTAATMDAPVRRPQLSALSYLDGDKVKREGDMAYMNRAPGAAQTLPAVTTASPTVYHPLGPPPPYSRAPSQHILSWSGTQVETSPPHDSRRPSDDEQEGIKQPIRQSLPSLSEALGVDGQTVFAPSAPAQSLPPPSASAHTSRTQLAAIASPSPSLKRGYGMDAPQRATHPAYAVADEPHSVHPQYQSENLPSQILPLPPPQPPADGTMPGYSNAPDRPQAPMPTSQAAARPQLPQASFTHSPTSTNEYQQPSAQPRGAMAPPNLPYGYTPYTPRHSMPVAHGPNAGPIYQPSTIYPPPSSSPSWKHDNMHSKFEGREYGESVKSHLDLFDLGTALREIASASSITSDFARRYDDQLQQPGRSLSTIQSLPGLVEVDDMISKSRVQLESLMRIRDFVVDQRALYEQEAADQRQQKLLLDQSHGDLEYLQDGGDGKTRFAGSDAKKRRGRAAPPGRCHSCNRAETPEWRRGPDGARTLCNACGLHYAKLTRKQQSSNKTAAAGSSNLRPKE